MIRSLAGVGVAARHVDVLVIGAGTAGLLLADRLHRHGLRVLCVESGSEEQRHETHALNEVEQLGTPYAGAAHGRFRCLGGTSTRWGGALIPFLPADLAPDTWPLRMEDLSWYGSQVEKAFGLPPGPYELPHVLGNDAQHIARLAKWPPFRKRNVAQLLRPILRQEAGPEIWLDATATDFELHDGRLAQVVVRGTDGSRMEIRAADVVMTCGAIESTRLLLLLDKQNGGLVKAVSPKLGLGFHDHLSAVVADIRVKDRKALNKLAGFRFEAGGVMRNLRFELAANSPLRAHLPACFAHVAFEVNERGGFVELRELLRLLQRGKLPKFALVGRLLKAAPWLSKAIYWRFVQRRLLYPEEAAIQLHMVIEQEVRDENYIDLSSTQFDTFGQPLARINWRVNDNDKAGMDLATKAMMATWNHSAIRRIAELHPRNAIRIGADMEAGGGIYHPGGTTRMGSRPQEGVVDTELKVFAVPNLRVVATSVMPTGGGANPTMTLLMLALRCADQLAKKQLGQSR